MWIFNRQTFKQNAKTFQQLLYLSCTQPTGIIRQSFLSGHFQLSAKVMEERLTRGIVRVSGIRVSVGRYRLLTDWLYGCHDVATSTAPRTPAHAPVSTDITFTRCGTRAPQSSAPLAVRSCCTVDDCFGYTSSQPVSRNQFIKSDVISCTRLRNDLIYAFKRYDSTRLSDTTVFINSYINAIWLH